MELGALSGALAAQKMMGQFLVSVMSQTAQASQNQTNAMIQMSMQNIAELAKVRPDGLGGNLDITA